MLSDDVLYLSATELAARLRSREVSAVELAESCLTRIERLDPRLRAFVTVTGERALAQARRADEEIAAGRVRGPLHGVPCGVKDLLAIRGVRTTWGATPFADQVLDHDATVVRKLEEAGAVLLGTVAMIELAGGLGYTIAGASRTGATANPWDTERWSCGSSSGSGAAVAAGLVPFAIGSDTAGSIICPSAFCGVSGVRPTFGRVSRHGAMPLAPSMDKLGPMARSAQDCEAVLAAIGGYDPLDEWSADEPPALALPAESARRFRVARLVPADGKPAEPGVDAAFESAVADLRSAGVSVAEVKLPPLPFAELTWLVIKAEATSTFEELFRDGRVRRLADPSAPISAGSSRAITAADYVKALRIRTLGQRAMAELFSEWDALLAPAERMTAPRIADDLEKLDWSNPAGAMSTLCGLPALAVPCGFAGGLPVGMTVVGGAFEEAKVFAVGKLYQDVTDWHRKRPPVA